MMKINYSFEICGNRKFQKSFFEVFSLLKTRQFNVCIFLLFFGFGYAQNGEVWDKVLKLYEVQYNDADKAIEIGNEIINNPNKSDIEYAYALMGIGTSYGIKGEVKKALEYSIKASQIAKKTDNIELITNTYGSVAQFYLKLGFPEKAKKYCLLEIQYAEKEKDEFVRNKLLSSSFMDLGQAYTASDKPDSAIFSLKKSLNYAFATEKLRVSKTGEREIPQTYLALANAYYNAQKLDSAEILYNNALNYDLKYPKIKEFRYNYDRAFANSMLGKIYYHRKEYERAIDSLDVSLEFNKGDFSYISAENFYMLAKSYLALNDSENYEKYTELYLSVRDKISDEERNALEESIKFDESVAQLQLKNKNRKITYLISGIVILIFAGLYILYGIKRKRKKEKQLYQQIISRLELQLNEKNTGTGIDFPKENQYQKSDKQPDETAKISSISDATEQELIKKLQKFEKSEKYTNKALSISLLATQLGTNTKYLSEVVSKHYGKNYNTYINDLRIDYICRKIVTDPEYRKFKITYLAEACGFSSYNTFTTIFKNSTGMSPSAFLKEATSQD